MAVSLFAKEASFSLLVLCVALCEDTLFAVRLMHIFFTSTLHNLNIISLWLFRFFSIRHTQSARHVPHPSAIHILCVLFYYRSVCVRYCAHIAFNITPPIHTLREKSTTEGHPPTHTDTHHLTLWNLIFRETGASGRDVPGRRTPAKARAEGALHLNHAPEEKSPARESERPIFYKFLTG